MTLLSRKDLTIMDLFPIELPGAVAGRGQRPELGDVALDLIAAGELLQILADQLVQALVHRLRHLTCFLDGLVVDRKRDVHGRSPRRARTGYVDTHHVSKMGLETWCDGHLAAQAGCAYSG